MKRNARRLLSGAVVVALTFCAAGCANTIRKLQARDLLNKGVAAYKGAQFDQAINFFMQAKEKDPTLLNARLYLATAYASQYIPGAPSEENVRRGESAVNEFKQVLDLDPNNLSAIDGIGSIVFQMASNPFDTKKFEESRTYHLRHVQLKPDDPEPYYWVGVINWTMAYRANREMRLDYNTKNLRRTIKDDEPLPTKVRQEFVAKRGETVTQGIDLLKKAIQLRPDYEDAMAYLNLLYRQKADIVESAAERDLLFQAADDLVDKVKEIKQKKMEAPALPPK
jgi:tetratricopeptide (TPR) repeat protein